MLFFFFEYLLDDEELCEKDLEEIDIVVVFYLELVIVVDEVNKIEEIV